VSRIGKKPVKLPEGVDVKIEDSILKVSKDGKTLTQEIHPDFDVEVNNEQKFLLVKRPSDSKMHKSLHGLYRALINNMVIGVSTGFEKKLEIVGVGYRAELKGKSLSLSIGFSHPVLFRPPKDVVISLESPTIIVVKSDDKQVVGQVAAKIRAVKPPEPYKGKGIRYVGEYVRKKAGKAAG